MVDNAVPTLVPESQTPDIPQSLRPPLEIESRNVEKEALFDSIAHEEAHIDDSSERSPLKTVFTSLLWFGYSVAVIVALSLVWSAAKGMLGVLPK